MVDRSSILLTLVLFGVAESAILNNINNSPLLPQGSRFGTRNSLIFEQLRGGSSIAEDEYDEYDEYDLEDEAEDVDDAKLAKATARAIEKSNKKKTQRAKEEVNKQLPAKKKVVKKSKSLITIPYILKAFLNPLTVMSMIKHYFASLFNVNYMEKKDSAAGLRSALEAKAKAGGAPTTGARKPKKRQRPGQAKTISDLPALG